MNLTGTPTTTLLHEHAAAEPDRPALIDAAGPVSYAQLDLLVGQLAGSLDRAGLRGRPVTLTARRHRDFPVGLLACWRAGTVAVIIDGEWPARRRQAAAAALTAEFEFGPAGPRPGGPAGPRPGGRAPAGDPAPGLAGLLGQASHVLFTSGSTGEPVATVVGAGAAEQALERQCAAFGVEARDRVAFLSHPAHDPALRDVLVPLRRGAAVCIPPPGTARVASRLAEWLAATRVTIVHAAPLLLRLLTDVPGARLPSLRLVVSGGAPLGSGLAHRVTALAPAARLVNGYGCTETPQLVTACDITAERFPARVGPLPIGTPLPGCRVEVRAAGGGLAATGRRGEIWVASPAIALGYWPPGARSGFVTDDAGLPWFRTGDLARRDHDGLLHFEGRLDRQVSVHGARVELDEIEAVARAQPGVAEAHVAFAREDGADRVDLWVQPDGPPITSQQVRAYLADRLPSPAVPARIMVVDQLGWTARMKPAPPASSGAAGAGGWTVDALATLARDHAEHLVGRPVGDEDNFFDAGFSSLSLFQLASALGEDLGQPVPPLTLFRYPNLAELSRHLHRLTSPGPAASTDPPDSTGG